MMSDAEKDEELDAMTSSSSSLLGNQRENQANDAVDIPFCGCLSIKFYQPFFDVDTSDIITRISHAVLFCRRERTFIASFEDKPDGYGPFWVN